MAASGALQFGGERTNQTDVGVQYAYRVKPAAAVFARFTHRITSWLTTEAKQDFAGEFLSTEVRWATILGAELRPFSVPIAREGWLRFELTVNAGVGLAQRFAELRGSRAPAEPVVLALGLVPAGYLAAGPRLRIGEHVAVRLELSGLGFPSGRVDQVNGCNTTDLFNLERSVRADKPLSEAEVSSSCDLEGFGDRGRGVAEALSLVREPTSEPFGVLAAQLSLEAMW